MTSPRELMNRQRELRAIGGSRNGDKIFASIDPEENLCDFRNDAVRRADHSDM